MSKTQRDIRRKRQVLEHEARIGDAHWQDPTMGGEAQAMLSQGWKWKKMLSEKLVRALEETR